MQNPPGKRVLYDVFLGIVIPAEMLSLLHDSGKKGIAFCYKCTEKCMFYKCLKCRMERKYGSATSDDVTQKT